MSLEGAEVEIVDLQVIFVQGAAHVEPNAFSNVLAASFDRNGLGYAVACTTMTMLVALTAGALKYARPATAAQVMRPGEIAG